MEGYQSQPRDTLARTKYAGSRRFTKTNEEGSTGIPPGLYSKIQSHHTSLPQRGENYGTRSNTLDGPKLSTYFMYYMSGTDFANITIDNLEKHTKNVVDFMRL